MNPTRCPAEGPTCIHAEKGLCPRCRADYDEDPLAWLEFGDHPEGIARQKALGAEIAAEREARERDDPMILPDDNIPF